MFRTQFSVLTDRDASSTRLGIHRLRGQSVGWVVSGGSKLFGEKTSAVMGGMVEPRPWCTRLIQRL